MNSFEQIYTKVLGRRTIMLSWEERIDEDLLYFILSVKDLISKKYEDQLVEMVHGYHCICITFKEKINGKEEGRRLIEWIRKESISLPAKRENERVVQLPVCYSKEYGWDLEALAVQKGLTIKEIIDLHTAPSYLVYFIGFLPGFPYLGGLAPTLFTDRKNEPRKKVPAGAVGIGGRQTGIYPKASPGGWQIIGNSPVPLFDPSRKVPNLLKAGDRLSFQAVSSKEYEGIKRAVAAGHFELKIQKS